MEFESKKNIADIGGDKFIFFEAQKGAIVPLLIQEIFVENCYGLDSLSLSKNETIIDIGAHVGVFSIYLAKKFPEAKILAFEPSKINYGLLLENISLNNAGNITAFNLAVYGDSASKVNLYFDETNSGASNIFEGKKYSNEAKTISLDDIIKNNNLAKVKLLKIDCEGSEYSIIYNSKLLDSKTIERIAIEIHKNPDNDPKNLLEYILARFKKENVFYKNAWGENEIPKTDKIVMIETKNGADCIVIKNMPVRLKIDKAIGKFGIFLKKTSPKLYLFAKKNIKINLRKKYIEDKGALRLPEDSTQKF